MSSISRIQTELDRIAASNDANKLKEELAECFVSTLGQVLKMAAIVRRLDDLGEQVSIDQSLLPYIRLVAHGQLSADLLVATIGETGILEKAMRLPLPLQERIARNEPLRVMESTGDHRMVPPLEMTVRERRQVFAGKKLRSDAEQVGWLKEHADREREKQLTAGAEPAVKVDKRRGGIVANGVFIPLAELAGYVASLSR